MSQFVKMNTKIMDEMHSPLELKEAVENLNFDGNSYSIIAKRTNLHGVVVDAILTCNGGTTPLGFVFKQNGQFLSASLVGDAWGTSFKPDEIIKHLSQQCSVARIKNKCKERKQQIIDEQVLTDGTIKMRIAL